MLRLSRTHAVLLPALSLSFALAACQPPAGTSTPATPTAATASATARPLLGRAVLVDPVAGATIKLLTLDGTVVKEYPSATNVDGAFLVDVPEGLTDFRVEATPPAGAPDNQNGTLRAEVRGYTPDWHAVSLNPVSSVVSRRVATNGVALDQAVAEARVTFALPEDSDTQFDLDDNKLVDETAFLQAAKAEGGFDTYVDNVAKTLGTPLPAPKLGSIVVEGAKFVAKAAVMELGHTLAKKYGDTPVIGSLLTKAFISAEETFRDDVRAALTEQNRKLDEISGRLMVIEGEVRGIRNDIAALEIKLNKQFGLAGYNSAIDPLIPTFSRIDTLYDDMQLLIRLNPTAKNKADILKFKERVVNEMPTLIDTLFKAEYGDVASRETGMARWERVVGNSTTGYPLLVGNEFASRLRAQREYFESYETKGLILLAEAENDGTDDGYTRAQARYDAFLKRFNAQEAATLVPEVGNDALISPRAGLMWARKLWAPDASKPDQFTIRFTRSPRGFSPVDPAVGLQSATIAGLTGWRVPTVAELSTLNPNHFNPVGGNGLTSQLMQDKGFDFGWGKYGWSLQTLWTSDVSGSGGVVFNLSNGGIIPAGTTDMVVLPVRKIRDWTE